jgi:hypothetical protein
MVRKPRWNHSNAACCHLRLGAILKVADGLLNVRQFTWEAQPYMLPHFKNVLDWSLPFVAEKGA